MELEKFCKQIASWLKRKGCKVVERERPQSLLFLKEGFWGVIEVKKTARSPKRPGQQEWVDWAQENSWGAFVWDSNWQEIQQELAELLK